MRPWLIASLIGVLVGCVPYAFDDTAPGRFEGDLVLRWVAPDLFVYEPDADRPFRFVRSNGDVIEPGRVVTDGGSVPRALWGIEGLSPWAFAPAYLIHDWLFQRHRCGYEHDPAGFEQSVAVMAEALRTLMGDDADPEALERYRAIVSISASAFARHHWEVSPCRAMTEPW